MMALCWLVFDRPNLGFAWKSLEGLLRRGAGGGTLCDSTMIAFVSTFKSRRMQEELDWYKMRDVFEFDIISPFLVDGSYILIEANLAYILDFWHRAFLNEMDDTATREARNFAMAEAARQSVQKAAKVLFVSAEESSAVYRPGSEADSTYFLEPFTTVQPKGHFDEDACQIPGLRRRIQQIASRGDMCSLDELRRDLEERGLIVAEEDVKDWPPKPFDCWLPCTDTSPVSGSIETASAGSKSLFA